MKFDQVTKEKIAKNLQEKGAVKPCSRCGNQRFSLLDGLINFSMTQEMSNTVIIGGPSVPCAVVGCDNCGHLEFHALGAIGLLSEKNK